MFYHGQKPFLLYSERAHFYKRYHIRGIRQLIFYQLPLFVAPFYAELADLVAEAAEAEPGVPARILVIAAHSDALRLAALLGPARARTLLRSPDAATFTLALSQALVPS